MGYRIATYNFPLFRRALNNFIFAVVASLVASTAYFAMSPISTAHSELLARTSPSIYDVLIALFGGLAGIVAISSKQKGNVIPGVAIATALMPPLCTAGYGLATGQLEYFFGALYLFTINTVFIAISSVVISQILKFPITTLVDNAQKKRVNRWISFVITLVLVPSIYFGYKLVQKEKFTENATNYINNIGPIEGNYLLKHEIHPANRSILLVYGGSRLTEEQKRAIIQKANDFSLTNASIEFGQGLSFDQFNRKSEEVNNLRLEIGRLQTDLQSRQKEIDDLTLRNYTGRQLLAEIKTMFPDIVSCSYGNSYLFQDGTDNTVKEETVIFTSGKRSLSAADKEKIINWLRTRLNSERIKVFFESSRP